VSALLKKERAEAVTRFQPSSCIEGRSRYQPSVTDNTGLKACWHRDCRRAFVLGVRRST
jgi:hypothetical protein